jgi:hypothetical protein
MTPSASDRIVHIGLVQGACSADPVGNLSRTLAAVERAAAQGARIVCTQELFRSQYFCQTEDHQHFQLAEPIPGPSTKAFQELARQMQVVVIASLFEKRAAGLYHNTAVVIDADGALLGSYRKMHIPDDPLYYEKGPDDAVEGSTGERSFTEHGLVIGTPLFVRGRASERPDIVAAQIKHEDKADMFIITPRKAEDISEGKATAFILWHIVGAAGAAGFGAALMAGARPEIAPIGLLIGLGLYLIAASAGWVWMVFNSITGLRNRVRQASSLIDIQLKRRADLIPPLVACVQGFRAHEASVQTLVAALRTQAAGARPFAVAPMLVAVAEQYPELKGQQVFAELSKNLVETEDRIALAPLRKPLRELQSNRCFYCENRLTEDTHIDHVVPWSRSGVNDLANLVLVDPVCNSLKSDALPSGEVLESATGRSGLETGIALTGWAYDPSRVLATGRTLLRSAPVGTRVWGVGGSWEFVS